MVFFSVSYEVDRIVAKVQISLHKIQTYIDVASPYINEHVIGRPYRPYRQHVVSKSKGKKERLPLFFVLKEVFEIYLKKCLKKLWNDYNVRENKQVIRRYSQHEIHCGRQHSTALQVSIHQHGGYFKIYILFNSDVYVMFYFVFDQLNVFIISWVTLVLRVVHKFTSYSRFSRKLYDIPLERVLATCSSAKKLSPL